MVQKEEIINFWNQKPCGTQGIIPNKPDGNYFKKIRDNRYKKEPFIFQYAQLNKWNGKKILEIGCGIGIDGLEFARNGARYYGIDITPKSIELAKHYFELNGYNDANLSVADAESLPFENNFFDYVYSWGVLHHTSDAKKAVAEIFRVLKNEGKFTIMLYNRHSLVACQLYLKYGLLKFNPRVSLQNLFSKHHESPGTKAYTNKELRELFKDFSNVIITNIVTPYDTRITKNIYFPSFVRKFIPSNLGFFSIIQGKK